MPPACWRSPIFAHGSGRHDVSNGRSQMRAGYAEKFPALARRRQPILQRQQHHFDHILLGHDSSGQPLIIPDQVRLQHMCTFGTTGSGKSVYAKNQILQDIRRGYGGVLFDPHGGHPGSPYSDCTAHLYEDGFFDSGRIYLIDPNTRLVMPINPLARVHNTDVSVIADALLKAFEITWGDEDTHQKPTIRTILRSTFMALAERNLPLADAKLLYDPHDRAGLRARIIPQLSNEYARDELSRIHQVALDDRSKREFNSLVIGPINRLNEFVASDAVSAMFSVVDEPGGPRRTLDLLDIMNRGEYLFVNLQHGEAFSEADASLLGAILLRNIALLAPRRTNREPFFVTMDEAHRFMVGDDLPSLFAEKRKYGISVHCLLQFEAQAGPRDELTAQAIENCTEVKTVFRVKSPEEAQRHAERVMPLSLELPVKASIRKMVVGHRTVQLASHASATHDAITHGEAETEGKSYASTRSHSVGETIGSSSSHMTGSGEFSATGENEGTVLTPAWQMFGGNGPTASLIPTPITESVGTSASRGASTQSASVESTSRATSESWGEAETRGTSRASTRAAHAWQEKVRREARPMRLKISTPIFPRPSTPKRTNCISPGRSSGSSPPVSASSRTAARALASRYPRPRGSHDRRSAFPRRPSDRAIASCDVDRRCTRTDERAAPHAARCAASSRADVCTGPSTGCGRCCRLRAQFLEG